MRFEYPYLLLILVPVLLLARTWLKRLRPPRVTFSLPVPREASASNPLQTLLAVKIAGIALAVVALARPQTHYRQTERQVSGVDIMMVMDVSASMNIEDLGDRPRLDVAKETMSAFVQARQNDRIGFVIFSGEPLTLAPPTLDYGLVLDQLRQVKTGTLKDGTGIGDGLALAVNRLKNSTSKSRVIVLLTDGDNNVGQVDPATAGDLAEGYGIRVYTIAIGKEGRVRLPIRRQGPLGNTITTYQIFDNALNPELLKQIAEMTHGRFYRVEEEGALGEVFREINQLEKSEVKTREKVHHDEVFQKPLKWAAVTLLLERVLAVSWWRILP